MKRDGFVRRHWDTVVTVAGVAALLYAVVHLLAGKSEMAMGLTGFSMACFAWSQTETLRSRLNRIESSLLVAPEEQENPHDGPVLPA